MGIYDDEELYDEFLYGEGLVSYYPPALDPEDARAVIADLYPSRVNWVGNPGFAADTDDDPATSWTTVTLSRYDDGALQYDADMIYDLADGTATDTVKATVTTAPYVTKAMEILPGTALRFSDFTDLQYAIPVMAPAGEDKPYEQYQQNLWKFAFLCRQDVAEETPDTVAPTGAIGGMLVRRTDGSTDLVPTTVDPAPLPWDYLEDREAVEIVAPYSVTGWYCVYEVLDLGPDAVWALPVLINGNEDDTIWFTAVIAERWDDVTLLQGPSLFMDVGDVGLGGDARLDPLNPWDYDWRRADLLALDPLVYFDGDSSLSTQTDFVWLPVGDGHYVSGYYPQRIQRVEGLRNLLREWLPVSRTASVRYALDTPRILRPA